MHRFYLLTTVLLLLGCSPQEKKNPDKILSNKDVPATLDLGEAKNGIYKNKYFGLSFEYDDEWFLIDHETLDEMADAGIKSVAKGELRKSIELSKVRTATLFGSFKFDPERTLGFNPSVLLIIENLKGSVTMSSGDDYLKQTKELWSQMQVDIKQVGSIAEAHLDGKESYTMISEITIPTVGVIRQEYFCTILKGFAVVFCISYSDESERDELFRAIESVRFKK